MPVIEFVESACGAAKVVEAAEGGPLVDLCDEHYAPVPFSCRSATCGTCHVVVLEGAEHLEGPTPLEADLLRILRGPPGSRLACQTVVKPGPGKVRLRPIDG